MRNPAKKSSAFGRVLRETRGNVLLGGIVLSATTIGVALEAAFSGQAMRPDARPGPGVADRLAG
jgi:hypothetical protein